jgi:hypothetical protein
LPFQPGGPALSRRLRAETACRRPAARSLFGALVSGSFGGAFPGSFLAGMRVSMLVAAALLIASSATALTVLRRHPA